jgi:hypothetical protein
MMAVLLVDVVEADHEVYAGKEMEINIWSLYNHAIPGNMPSGLPANLSAPHNL